MAQGITWEAVGYLSLERARERVAPWFLEVIRMEKGSQLTDREVAPLLLELVMEAPWLLEKK